jgi:AcrR family transcriptional regulator
MGTAAETVRRGRKFDQVLEGAREVFFADGFEGASVDTIARAAGVSKATLYSYFPDKRLLFMAVARAECGRQADVAIEPIDPSAPPDQVLAQAGRRLLDFLLSDFGLRVFRICVAECDRFPELGRAFYDSGPGRVHRMLADYLRGAVARGSLAIEDVDLAADQFAELCKADLFPRLMLGLAREVTEAERTRVIDGAVATFLARYGVPG